MRCLLLFILLLLPTLPLKSEAPRRAAPPFSHAPIPHWVKPCECSLEPLPLKPSQVNFQFLLNDTQCYWPDDSLYIHYAIKPLTFEGAAVAAKVEIEFCPSYQNALVHRIRVFREGKWEDRFTRARHSLLQRESELEDDLYSGSCTLVYFLEDIRVGDIVEYAYTIEGTLPYFATHLTSGFSLQGPVIVEHLYRRLLASSEMDIDYRLFHTSHEPQITDLSPETREWAWELEQTEPFADEEHSPEWHFPVASVQFSQYKSWGEVIDKLLPLFTLSDERISDLPPEMLELTQYWMESGQCSSERALFALRFVQEEVRYLGFEEGLDGIRPANPGEVFLRRFGDCKDKTFLLHALLQCMGIESTPVLVSSTDGKYLPESMPLPFAFDHIILRIDIDGCGYWVDSTIVLQGGSCLAENFCPIYYWGLPLSASERSLVPIPGNFDEKPTLIDTSFVLSSPDFATLEIVRTFQGHKADAMRRFLNVVGTYSYSGDFCDTLQRSYGRASLASDPVLYDDRQKNILVLSQSYSVPTEKMGEKKYLKAFSIALLNYLENDINPERNTPYALNYPVWVKEHLHVETPYIDWESDSDEYQYDHEALSYTYLSERGGSSFDGYFELRHLKDHVAPEAVREYWELTNEIEQDSFFNFYVADVDNN